MMNKKQIDNSDFLSFIFRSFLRVNHLLYNDRVYAEKRYNKVFNKKLNLKSPEGFNEKIQWLKLYDRTPLHTICADKIEVRRYVSTVIGSEYLIPLLKIFNHPNELTKEFLQKNAPLILKCNHNSSGYKIIRKPETVDLPVIRDRFKRLLKINYYYQGREWQYKNIAPKLYAEKLLTDKEGQIPSDFKFFCFNGQPRLIQVDIDRQNNHKRNFYNLQWEPLNFEFIYPRGEELPKPKTLNLMIQLCKKLSEPFCFCRIDLYEVKNQIYFGEITFHPESGFGKFSKPEEDIQLGEKLKLPQLH